MAVDIHTDFYQVLSNTPGLGCHKVVVHLSDLNTDESFIFIEVAVGGEVANGDAPAYFKGDGYDSARYQIPITIDNASDAVVVKVKSNNPGDHSPGATVSASIQPVSVKILSMDTSVIVAIEAVLADDTIGEPLKQAFIDKLIENMPELDDISVAALRDALLNRVLAGNHDTDGTVGKVLQYLDAAITSRGDATLANQTTLIGRLGTPTDGHTVAGDAAAGRSAIESVSVLVVGGAFTSAALANAPTGSTISYSVSSAKTGEAPRLDIVMYQYAAIGPLEITAEEAQSGCSHELIVFDPSDPAVALWSLSSGDGEISVGGDGDLTITIEDDDTHTQTAGERAYVLRNTTADKVVCRGSLAIEEMPDAA